MRSSRVAIEENIEARKTVEEFLKLLDESMPDVQQHRVYYVLAKIAAEKCGHTIVPKTTNVEPMVMHEALEFEKRIVPQRQFAGMLVKDVHPNQWLRDTEGEFCRSLLRYLKSKRFQSRQ